MRYTVLATVAVSLAIGACQAATTPGGGASLRNVITQDQIDSSYASNVYELIVRLHPEYLRDRGSVSIRQNIHARAVVFLNGHEYGILETMRNIPISGIGEIRYYAGTDAVVKFGSQYGGGVVELISRVE
jgi:hypothetical protein